jgi:hypothetical protein
MLLLLQLLAAAISARAFEQQKAAADGFFCLSCAHRLGSCTVLLSKDA